MDHLRDCLDGGQLEEVLEQIKRLCQRLRRLSSVGSYSNEVMEAADGLDPRLTRIISREEALLISQSWVVKQPEDSNLGTFSKSAPVLESLSV